MRLLLSDVGAGGGVTVAAAAPAPHLPAWLAVPLGMLVGFVLAWLWWRVGRAGVARSRRFIRRTSLLLALMLVPMLVVGTSFVDSASQPRRYVEVWVVAMAILALIVLTAIADAINSVRLLSAERRP